MEGQSEFSLFDDRFKRSKYPAQSERKRLWLDQRSFGFVHNSQDFPLLYSKDLAKRLSAGFLALQPVYELMMLAEAGK